MWQLVMKDFQLKMSVILRLRSVLHKIILCDDVGTNIQACGLNSVCCSLSLKQDIKDKVPSSHSCCVCWGSVS